MALDPLGAASAIIPPALAALSPGIVGRKMFPECRSDRRLEQPFYGRLLRLLKDSLLPVADVRLAKCPSTYEAWTLFGFFSALSCALMTRLKPNLPEASPLPRLLAHSRTRPVFSTSARNY